MDIYEFPSKVILLIAWLMVSVIMGNVLGGVLADAINNTDGISSALFAGMKVIVGVPTFIGGALRILEFR